MTRGEAHATRSHHQVRIPRQHPPTSLTPVDPERVAGHRRRLASAHWRDRHLQVLSTPGDIARYLNLLDFGLHPDPHLSLHAAEVLGEVLLAEWRMVGNEKHHIVRHQRQDTLHVPRL